MKHVLIASLVLVGCGSKKDDKQNAPTPAEPAVKEAPPPEVPKPEAPAAAVDTTYGFCHVTGSGAVTFDQKTGHTGGSMLNIMQWHTEEMRQQVGYAAEGIILNCLGKEIRLNLLSDKTKPFPTKPATYKLGRNGDLVIMGTVPHPDEKRGLSLVPQTGTLEITAFDDNRIAGKGELVARTMPDKGELKLAIDFDLQCRNLSGCVKK